MLDDSKRAQIDQELAEMAEVLPKGWRAIYLGCIAEGFSEEQAMRIIIAFIQKPNG